MRTIVSIVALSGLLACDSEVHRPVIPAPSSGPQCRDRICVTPLLTSFDQRLDVNVRDIDTNTAGEIAAIVAFRGFLELPGGRWDSGEDGAIMLLKLSPDGTVDWARLLGGQVFSHRVPAPGLSRAQISENGQVFFFTELAHRARIDGIEYDPGDYGIRCAPDGTIVSITPGAAGIWQGEELVLFAAHPGALEVQNLKRAVRTELSDGHALRFVTASRSALGLSALLMFKDKLFVDGDLVAAATSTAPALARVEFGADASVISAAVLEWPAVLGREGDGSFTERHAALGPRGGAAVVVGGHTTSLVVFPASSPPYTRDLDEGWIQGFGVHRIGYVESELWVAGQGYILSGPPEGLVLAFSEMGEVRTAARALVSTFDDGGGHLAVVAQPDGLSADRALGLFSIEMAAQWLIPFERREESRIRTCQKAQDGAFWCIAAYSDDFAVGDQTLSATRAVTSLFRYTTPGVQVLIRPPTGVELSALEIGSDGSAWVVGTISRGEWRASDEVSLSVSSNGDTSEFALKLDATGAVVAGGNLPDTSWVGSTQVRARADGGAWVRLDQHIETILTHLGPDAAIRSSVTLDDEDWLEHVLLAVAPDDSVRVSGVYNGKLSADGDLRRYAFDDEHHPFVLSFSAAGTLEWDEDLSKLKQYPTSRVTATKVLVRANNTIVGLREETKSGDQSRHVFAELVPEPELRWVDALRWRTALPWTRKFRSVRDLHLGKNGTLRIVGEAANPVGGHAAYAIDGPTDAFILELDTSGTILRDAAWGREDRDSFYQVISEHEDDLIVLGRSRARPGSDRRGDFVARVRFAPD